MNLKRAALLALGIAAGVWVLPATHGEVQHTTPPAAMTTPEPAPADEMARKLQKTCGGLPAATGFHCDSTDTDGK
jgi:hypothetical protein